MTVRALVATDGDAPASAALTLLERLGDRDELELSVMCVATFDLALEAASEVGRYSPEEARSLAADMAERATAGLREAGFRAEPVPAEGHPTVEILRHLEEGGADVAVVGGGKRTWLNQLLLGSVSTAVLQSSPCPVLVVREVRREAGTARVLVGADGSDAEAGHADRPAELLERAGWNPERSVEAGHAAEVLLRHLERSDPDLVVAGARGAGTVRRTPLGSVTDKLVHLARATLVGR
jgi:nucleotide-binding universal stress UspA family protein